MGAGLVPIPAVPKGGMGAGLVPIPTVNGGMGAGLVPIPATLRRTVTVVNTTNNASKNARLNFFTAFLQSQMTIWAESLSHYLVQVNTIMHTFPTASILTKSALMSSNICNFQ